jgi:hypothetical protein
MEGWIILGLILACIIGVGIFSRGRSRKLRVTLANNEIRHFTRPWYYFWLFDGSKMVSFRKEDGTRIRIASHWIISIEDE